MINKNALTLSLTLLLLLSACVTSTESVKRDGILCLYDEAARQWVSDCLDPATAKAEEVYRRVVIYNDHLEEKFARSTPRAGGIDP